MALTDDDVREILRLIDESELDELRIETGEFKLHVVRGGAVEGAAAERRAPLRGRPDGPAETIDAPMPGTFYRAEGPGHGRRSWRSARASSRTPWSA